MVKTKRSRNHEKRQRARLMREIAKHDPDYAFRCAVLEKHPSNYQLRLHLRVLRHASSWQTYTVPKGVSGVNVTMIGGGGGVGSNTYGAGGGGASGQQLITVTVGSKKP